MRRSRALTGSSSELRCITLESSVLGNKCSLVLIQNSATGRQLIRGSDMMIFKDSHKSTYLPLSRPEWFRFNESAHVMVKQKTLTTDLSRRLGLVKTSFRSNPSVLVKSGQMRAVSGQIRAVFGIVARIYLPTYMFLRNFLY